MKTRLLALAVLAAGCDPTVFGDLGDSTWVVSSGAPSGTGSTGFGAALVAPAAVSPTNGFSVVGLAQSPAAVGTVNADLRGSIDGEGGPIEIGMELSVVMAGSPLAAAPVAVDGVNGGLVAVGLPGLEVSGDTGAVSLHDAAAIATVRAAFSNPSTDSFGNELVLLDPAGDGSSVDLVAASDTRLFLYADVGAATGTNGITPVSCTIAANSVLALVAGELDGTAGDEILAVIDDGGDDNQIVVLTSAAITAAAGGDCAPPTSFASPSPAPDFGFASAVGNFDADAAQEVVLASPSTNAVFVIEDLTGTATMVSPGAGVSEFGFSLAAGDIDGDGNDDLAVGAPGTRVEGVVAGAVTVLLGTDTGLDTDDPLLLHDAEPDGGQRFGRSVVIAPFFSGGNLVRGALVVGADEEIFSYFRTPVSSDLRDPSPSE